MKMLFASPDGDTTFAATWEDNPPVARVNDRVPDRTLQQARDGILTRTRTSLVTQTQITNVGYPALDMTAKNSEGGYLDARLIYLNDRLYTLMALFPTTNARREQDVIRFYNSFAPLRVGTKLPEATQGGISGSRWRQGWPGEAVDGVGNQPGGQEAYGEGHDASSQVGHDRAPAADVGRRFPGGPRLQRTARRACAEPARQPRQRARFRWDRGTEPSP